MSTDPNSLAEWVDGVPAFSVADATHPGGVGLYCWANSGAHFRSVVVTAAAWTRHHRFGDKGLVEAGTLVVLHSGAAADLDPAAAPAAPGVVHRFAAIGAGRGHRGLPGHRPVDVRLRDATGGDGHARRFLPAGAYAPVTGLRVLRKADGTELFLCEPAGGGPGATLAAGQHRLSVTYRRDNIAAIPGSQVLSRAGDRGDEQVTLDVPWSGP